MDSCVSKSDDQHPSVDGMTPTWEQHCQPPKKLSHAAAAAVNLNRENVEWTKHKSKQGGVWCNHWSSCCNVICVCWMARRRPVADWPSIWDLLGGINQMTVFIIIAVLHCLLFVEQTVCWPVMCDRVNVAVNWVCVWRTAHTWHLHSYTISYDLWALQ